MKKKVLIGIVVGIIAFVFIIIAVVLGITIESKINCKHDDPSQIVVVEGKSATCQENGLTKGKKCNLCGTMVEPQTIVEKGECLNYKLTKDGNYSVSRSSMCICTEIVIPKTYEGITVTNIGYEAFYDCTSLTSVVIPDSVTSVGDKAFAYCNSLTSIEIPDSVTSIGDWAFMYCDSLTSIVIPNSVTSISDGAFTYCYSLRSIEIPDSVTSIGHHAFVGCASLTSIEIPDSVTRIGNHAFDVCDSLTNIGVDENNKYYKSIDGNLYTKDGKTLIQYAIGKKDMSFTIPNFVTRIGDFAFYRCSSLTSIEIPDSVTRIGDYAFDVCDSLTNITFEGTIEQWKAIRKGVFWSDAVSATEVVCSDGTASLN